MKSIIFTERLKKQVLWYGKVHMRYFGDEGDGFKLCPPPNSGFEVYFSDISLTNLNPKRFRSSIGRGIIPL